MRYTTCIGDQLAKQGDNSLRDRELGTAWVEPGQGSTWRRLFDTFGWDDGIRRYPQACYYSISVDKRTNLKVTGSPLQPIDRERWESRKVA